MKKIILVALSGLLVFLGVSSSQTSAGCCGDSCGQKFTYEKSSDYDDSRIHFEYEEDESWKSDYKRTISVTAGSGYKINKVWLDVDNDGHSGYWQYASGPLNNFNPNPGDKINQAKAEVEKVCASPSPSPSPSVSPSPAVSPSPSVTPSPEPSPEPEPTPSPESSPAPGEQIVLELGIDGPKCNEGHFHLSAYPKKNGVTQSGVKVEFWYNGITKSAVTSSPAEVDFDFQGNGKVIAKADGYPTAEIGVEAKKDCPAGGAPEVLGAATEGQVLGAMADTGSGLADLFNLVFGFGAGLIGLGVKTYAKKNQ
jgi:hypothetical protein